MADFEEMKSNYDLFKDESGNLVLRPKKKARNDFENSLSPSNSTYEDGTSNSSIMVEVNDPSITFAKSGEMETSAANSDEMETSAQV